MVCRLASPCGRGLKTVQQSQQITKIGLGSIQTPFLLEDVLEIDNFFIEHRE